MKKTKNEMRFQKVLKETVKGLVCLALTVILYLSLIELYMGDFFSVYDSQMHIIWWRKIVRWGMYDVLIAGMIMSGLAVKACLHRAAYDFKRILSED